MNSFTLRAATPGLTSSICGIDLPAGLHQCDALGSPLFTPATKAESGHDENVSFEQMKLALGDSIACELRDRSTEVYRKGNAIAKERGIIVADTKLEWGWFEGRLILIDEVLTPDSSRFWPSSNRPANVILPPWCKSPARGLA